MGDLTRKYKYNQKKSYSVAATEVAIDFSDLETTDAMDIFKLPANCLITNAHLVVDTAFNAASTLLLKADAVTLIAAVAADATGVKPDALSAAIDVGTGATITLTPSATMVSGAVRVVVEFIEIDLGCGQHMQVAQS